MRNLVLVFLVVFAAVLLQPMRLDAFKYGFDPSQPFYAGVLREDSTCPGATHVLLDICTQRSRVYLVFKQKGAKHRLNTYQVLQGPIVTTTCSVPLVDVRHIHPVTVPPPPCGP